MQSAPHWLLLLLAVFVASVLPFVPTSTLPWSSSADSSTQYVVLIDGGSSGSRVHVHPYTLPAASSSSSSSASPPLPVISPSFSLKVKPGLSAFATAADAAKSLLPLLDFATKHVPAHLHASTPIYLYATAGLRTIPLPDAERILFECRRILATSPFLFQAERVRIISGVQEGINGWIAANYLSRHFDSSSSQDSPPQTVGVLEMGGASFQLTYAPADPSRLPEQLLIPLHIGQHSFQIYTASYLNYGLEKAQELYTKRHNHQHYRDPCYPEGKKGRPANGSLAPADSSGDYEACVQLVDQLILHDIQREARQQKARHDQQQEQAHSQEDEWEHPTGQPSSSTPAGDSSDDDTAIHESGHVIDCSSHQCSFNGHLIPPIAPHEHFVAIENFYYTSEFFQLLNPVTDASTATDAAGAGYVAMDLLSMREKGRYYCQLRWEQIDREWPGEPKDDLEKYCFSAAYLPRVLEIGLGMTSDAQHNHVSARQQQSDDEVADVQLTEAVAVETEGVSRDVLRVDRSVRSERKSGLLHNVRITKHIDGVAIDWALGAVLLEVTNHLHKDRYEATTQQQRQQDEL